jgi:hypothetical protein
VQSNGGAVEMKLLSIPVGVSDFAEIRRNGYYYVDKSGLIGELLGTTGTKVTLITPSKAVRENARHEYAGKLF